MADTYISSEQQILENSSSDVLTNNALPVKFFKKKNRGKVCKRQCQCYFPSTRTANKLEITLFSAPISNRNALPNPACQKYDGRHYNDKICQTLLQKDDWT